LSNTTHILQYKTLSIWSFLRNLNSEKVIKIIVGLFVVSCFFFGSLFFFYRIFDYLSSLADIGDLLMNKIISLGFLAIFIMLIISNIVTSISTLYKSRETSFLLSTPASHFDVFSVKFIDNIFFSTWAVLLMGLPLIFAYGLVRGFEFWHYIFMMFCALLPYVIIPACIGVAFSMIMFSVSKHISPRGLMLSFGSLIVLTVVIYFKFGQPSSMALNTVSDWRVLNRFLGSMGATSFPFLPSYWMSEMMRSITDGIGRDILVNMLALVSTMFLFINMVFAAGRKYYFSSWLASNDHVGPKIKVKSKRANNSSFFKFPNWLKSDFRAVLAKDLKLVTREPAQWAQFTVLLALLAIYLLNLKYFPTDIKDSYWKTIIGFANFAFSGFILATLSVRFVFPNISLEGRAFWAVISSPMPLTRFFWVKFWSAFLTFVMISEVLAFVSNIMLGLRGVLMILTFVSVLMMSISLTSLSVGLGAVYPRFEERNPGKIASSIGGMITTVIGLIYVGLMVVITAMPAHKYSLHKMDPTLPFPRFEVLLALGLMLFLNLLTIILSLSFGIRSLGKRDF
jgi:ABC-2 type transport system permease protein